jgi:excisionase family DNA binding protein
MTTPTLGDLPPILTSEEARRLLRISRGTLLAEVHAVHLPAIWVSQRCLRFSRTALERWLEDQNSADAA